MRRKKGRQRRRMFVTFALSVICFIIVTVVTIWYFAFGGEYRAGYLNVSCYQEIGREQLKDIILGDLYIYEPPEYNFKLDEITVEIAANGGVFEREYNIAFVNDLHIITDNEPGDVLEENLPMVRERYENLAVTSEGVHAEELWPEVIKFLNYQNFDAVIFGGDMLDYSSHSNMNALTEGFDNLKYPKEKLLYLRSDHDYGGWYGGSTYTDTDGFIAQTQLWDGDQGEGWIEFDEFLIVGVNKSYQNLSDERLEFLMEKLNAGKPVIVASHVPFYSQEDESLEKVREEIYYWSPENSIYCPDQNTQKFMDCMYGEDSAVTQILAAHVHAAWDGNVTKQMREHIFAPTYEGRIGVIHVVIVNDTNREE